MLAFPLVQIFLLSSSVSVAKEQPLSHPPQIGALMSYSDGNHPIHVGRNGYFSHSDHLSLRSP